MVYVHGDIHGERFRVTEAVDIRSSLVILSYCLGILL